VTLTFGVDAPPPVFDLTLPVPQDPNAPNSFSYRKMLGSKTLVFGNASVIYAVELDGSSSAQANVSGSGQAFGEPVASDTSVYVALAGVSPNLNRYDLATFAKSAGTPANSSALFGPAPASPSGPLRTTAVSPPVCFRRADGSPTVAVAFVFDDGSAAIGTFDAAGAALARHDIPSAGIHFRNGALVVLDPLLLNVVNDGAPGAGIVFQNAEGVATVLDATTLTPTGGMGNVEPPPDDQQWSYIPHGPLPLGRRIVVIDPARQRLLMLNEDRYAGRASLRVFYFPYAIDPWNGMAGLSWNANLWINAFDAPKLVESGLLLASDARSMGRTMCGPYLVEGASGTDVIVVTLNATGSGVRVVRCSLPVATPSAWAGFIHDEMRARSQSSQHAVAGPYINTIGDDDYKALRTAWARLAPAGSDRRDFSPAYFTA
jgi:hypothetical protein